MESAKPHHGRITSWCKVECTRLGLGYIIVGRFLDHPTIGRHGSDSHTSYVVAHDPLTGEIETRNSRYTLIDPENADAR